MMALEYGKLQIDEGQYEQFQYMRPPGSVLLHLLHERCPPAENIPPAVESHRDPRIRLMDLLIGEVFVPEHYMVTLIVRKIPVDQPSSFNNLSVERRSLQGDGD